MAHIKYAYEELDSVEQSFFFALSESSVRSLILSANHIQPWATRCALREFHVSPAKSVELKMSL